MAGIIRPANGRLPLTGGRRGLLAGILFDPPQIGRQAVAGA